MTPNIFIFCFLSLFTSNECEDVYTVNGKYRCDFMGKNILKINNDNSFIQKSTGRVRSKSKGIWQSYQKDSKCGIILNYNSEKVDTLYFLANGSLTPLIIENEHHFIVYEKIKQN